MLGNEFSEIIYIGNDCLHSIFISKKITENASCEASGFVNLFLTASAAFITVYIILYVVYNPGFAIKKVLSL